MKKRLFSILLALCMVLCLVPTTAFAESETEEPPVCSCETACTAEAMNADCPICGVEGASVENCAKYVKPIENAEPEGEENEKQPEGEENEEQPEGEVSDPQPETALTALIGGSETAKDVSTAEELTAAIADVNFNTVKLAANIDISSSLTVNRTVTLDLNGHVLKYESANKGSVIVVEGGGQLTIEDSNTSNLSHRFNPNGKLWVLDEASGTETVTGGVITGGTGYPILLYGSYYYYGGGVYIAPRGQLTMIGGNIIGCSAEYGGGVCIYPGQTGEPSQFSMSGGGGVYAYAEESVFNMSGTALIRDCRCGVRGGGVRACGTFQMSGQAVIRNCTAESATEYIYGGGVYVNSSSNFVMSDEAKIEDCQAISNSSKPSKGGGVYLTNATMFTLSGNAVIQNCTATNSVNPGETYGGGVMAAIVKEITLANSASIAGCTAANGSGLYITGSLMYPNDWGKLYANGGSVNGDVVLGDKDKSDGPCTITGTGETVFKGKVTVTPDSTIEKGTFNGEVINNGTITGGTFNGEVINNGTITDGVFTGIVSGSGTITGGTFNPRITGNGTETDPYQISTADGLKWFRDKVNNAKAKEETKICAVLTADIDLNNEPWTPIGIGEDTRTEDLPYSGTFDGNGHTISGLNVNYGDKNGGLFCYVKSATIKNLTVAGSVTYSSGDGIAYGGIVGCADSSTIENCTNRCTVTGNWYAGGIVGRSVDSDIIGCANFGNISSPFRSGGICGIVTGQVDAYGIDATIRDCYNVGMVSGKYAGGITGQSDSGNIDILIANCYNVGSLHGNDATGEIIGGLSNPRCTTIDNCYYLPTGNPASTSDLVYVNRTDSKTAAEFANGTVRKLLKDGERGNNADPWAGECKYLDAAGKTLPVFNGQGDAHDHQSNDWEHNDTEHWQVCTCGAVFNKAEHSGGKATCKDKAICEICGDSYGNLDPNNHTDLKHIDAKAATAAEEGNIAYWYCDGCKKYFSDAAAKTEIAKADTVTAKRSPQITAGDGAAVTQGEKKELTFTSDASFADFLRVELDGTTLDERNYTKKEGSTIITLNRDFVATLSVGEHTLAIVSQHGTATAKFTVKAKPAETAPPQPTVTPQPTAQPTQTAQPVSPILRTGDTANPTLWFALLIVSGGAAIGITVASRKKKHNK